MAGVTTDKGDISAGVVVNAAGPWGAKLAADAGVSVPLTVTRHPVVVMQRPPAWRAPTPVWGDLIGGWYFKPDGESGIMVGSVRDDHRSVGADDYNQTPTHEEIATASAAIVRRFPVMEDGTARKGWAGVYDVTPDSQPVIDAVARVPASSAPSASAVTGSRSRRRFAGSWRTSSSTAAAPATTPASSATTASMPETCTKVGTGPASSGERHQKLNRVDTPKVRGWFTR